MTMSDEDRILALLSSYAEAETLSKDDKLFGSGLNLSSVSYTEFVLEFEDMFDTEVELAGLDHTDMTVGRFIEVLKDFI